MCSPGPGPVPAGRPSGIVPGVDDGSGNARFFRLIVSAVDTAVPRAMASALRRWRYSWLPSGLLRGTDGCTPEQATTHRWMRLIFDPSRVRWSIGPLESTMKPTTGLERDDFWLNHHSALASCLSMIFSENRYPLFEIML